MTQPLAALTILGAVVAALGADAALAQPQQLAPIATAPAAAAPAVVADSKKAATHTVHRWRKADARVCLEFPNDMQVIKCSENYR